MILEYLVARGNEEISVGRMAIKLEMDKKTVASIAGRLAARGIIRRTSRGVYVHRQESIGESTVGDILSKLETTIGRTFGRPILERTNLASIRERKDIQALEEALRRTRKIIGVRGADNLFRLVTKKVARASESRYILASIGVTI